MRLIDLDEFLRQSCVDRMDGKSCEECKYHVLEVSCERLMEQPAIDPVKKGKWIKLDGSLWNMANCSECGEMCVLGDTAKFCPFCGASMIGVITKKRGRR